MQRFKFIGLVSAALFIIAIAPLYAQDAGAKPMVMPVAQPAGPSTWLLGQPYGNTIGAFLRGSDWYEAGQRLHFGIDLSMPCGTPLVAVADGVVAHVDDLSFGSGPHNLILRHDALGLRTLYGHLLDRPNLVVGQTVTQGDLVGYSGDPDITCDSRPHLHLEIRALAERIAYNPVDYIEANWHALATVGSFRYPVFQQDLDNARRWMSLDDQPAVQFGGAALNNYAAPFPDMRFGQPPANPPLERSLPPLAADATYQARRLAFDGCCTGAFWHPTDTARLYTIDGVENQRASIFEWNPLEGTLVTLIGQAPPAQASADGTHEIQRISDTDFRFRRLSDGAEWTINTGGAWPSFNRDNTQLMWQFASQIALPGETRPRTDVFVANQDGSNLRSVLSEQGASAQWLDDRRLLISQRDRATTTLRIHDITDGSWFDLGQWDWLRSLTVAPGGGRLMFYTVYNPDPAVNGVYTVRTLPGSTAQRLPWFGAWRWRDADSVYYIPFEPENARQRLGYYHITSGQTHVLTDALFTIADGDWSVSPDGERIAFWNAEDKTTWLLERSLGS